jgi:hypothetical protein
MMFKKIKGVYPEKQTKLKEGSNKPLKVALKNLVSFRLTSDSCLLVTCSAS